MVCEYGMTGNLVCACVSLVTACSAGRYGLDCARTVLCGDGALNDPVSGRCVCIPGRRGEDCGHGELSQMFIRSMGR